jgi:hypothetical protein
MNILDSLSSDQQRTLLDDNAEMEIRCEIGHEAIETAGTLWAAYALVLIEEGAERSTVERICSEGYSLCVMLNEATALENALRGFKYPGSGNVISAQESCVMAFKNLKSSSDPRMRKKMDRQVFKGFLDDALSTDEQDLD